MLLGRGIMTVEEVAQFLHMSLSWVYKHSHELGAVKLGGSLFFPRIRRTSMSVYSKKGKGWRYDFTLKGERYTQAWFPTKTKAKQAESRNKKGGISATEGNSDPNRHELLGVGESQT